MDQRQLELIINTFVATRVSQSGLMSLLQNHVVEAIFVRRHIKSGHPPYRRALITNCNGLLNSDLGRKVLHFHPPKGFAPRYSIVQKNLVLTWDLFWQDYRTFNAEGAQLVQAMPVTNVDDQEHFWQYFQTYLIGLSPSQKMAFMDT